MKRSERVLGVAAVAALLLAMVAAAPMVAQQGSGQERIVANAENRPLESLKAASALAKTRGVVRQSPREMINFRGEGSGVASRGASVPDALLQPAPGNGPTSIGTGFFGMSNNDNGALLGFLIAPPDTDGAVGPNHFVQMINLLTAVYDLNGNVVMAPAPSNAIWAGQGGNCGPYNQGDPIVLYDDDADRWLVSQFAFPDSLSTFSQCVAISQTGDPTGAYNRYEFSFNNIGFNDYPKHGIVSDSITMMANLFKKRGPRFSFDGTFLGVMDKDAMYAGGPASLIGFKIGKAEFGFVAGDLDGGGSAPALFATAMSQLNSFDIWEIPVDWSTGSASASRIASIPISPYDGDLCSASREACIPQPSGGTTMEAISDRLMHRLQIRDFGAYRTMVTAHTVDVGGGRAGLRWYEMRESSGSWSLYQEGTFAPDDGLYRWMPSLAMNAAGDLGVGYLLGGSSTFVSTAVAGQSAGSSGSGQFDSEEVICAPGSGVQSGTGRSGDYSATSIHPDTDTFWHTNEVFTASGQFLWNTYICEFSVGSGGANPRPTASFTSSCANLDCDFDGSGSSDLDGGTIESYDWNFGDGNTGSGVALNHVYAVEGDYTVVLTVTDDGGATDTDSQSLAVSNGVNDPPVAAFDSSCSAMTCDFTDMSTDIDGTVVGWDWDFGDGSPGEGGAFTSHRYAIEGTYTVTLTVTDDGGAMASTQNDVTVSFASGITLSASGYKVKGRQRTDLSWSGASGGSVDVYRSGSPVATTANDGAYTDVIGVRGGGSYSYQVCEAGTSKCSNVASVSF
jgi:PKD repeat protein